MLGVDRRCARAEADGETIVIVDRVPDADRSPSARDRSRALADAPFVTIVHPDEHPAAASVADAIGATVGAQTRSLGGLGAYAAVTVRGAAPGHTEVLVDGVPLARLAAVTTDLGRFALDAFGEVDLYRGAVPIELGGAGVGGALDLITHLGRGERGERVRASIGGGSFGARHLRLHYGDRHLGGRLRSSTTIGYRGATGDYTYYDDNGTPLDPRNGTFSVRRNNGYDQVDAASRVGAVDRREAGGLRVAWQRQGLAGSAQQPALAASLTTLDVIADARDEHEVGPATARELGYVLVEQQHLRDAGGEVGIGAQDRAYLTLSGGASTTWSVPVGDQRATGGVELRGDRFRDVDRGGARGALVGDREGAAVLAAVALALDPRVLALTPAVRLDVVRTAPTPISDGPGALAPIASRWDVVPSPRLTARAAVRDDLSIKASTGWYVRLPTLVELFGDRGTILGSPTLRPERGTSSDVGMVWAPARGFGELDRIFVETATFATRARDTIALVSTAGYVARAANVADAQSYGVELVASARLARAISLTANYTRLVTEQVAAEPSLAGKALPRQPAHALHARLDVVHRVRARRLALWLDGGWHAESFLDEANLRQVPARVLVGVGARVELGGGVALALAVDNVADVRVEYLPLVPPPRPDLMEIPTAVADFAGYPLPGRSLYLTVEWSDR